MTRPAIHVREDEVVFTAIRAQGAGGQNVNKVSSAIHLRFSIPESSLPDSIKASLMSRQDHRITADGLVVIKAQGSRSQEQNRIEAMIRLQALVDAASVVQKTRKATRPTLGSKHRRLEGKAVRGQIKRLRVRINHTD
ncbi:aminoacyl-tRNA hydrolase [Alcaligenaceae bacterium]|nr:aminoacyl-tRNA hydrolase [Alcaligenaceae bacterium]